MHTKNINLGRFNKGLLAVLLVAVLLYFGKPLLLPLAIAAFFAMLLYPVVQRLHGMKLKSPIAELSAVLILLATLLLLSAVVYYQLRSLQSDLPRLEVKAREKASRLQWLLYETTDLTYTEQEQIVEEKKPDIAKAIYKSVRDLVMQTLAVLLFVFIVLTYTFFLLVYQQRIRHFFVQLRLFESQKESKVMLARISRVIHHYLKGTFTVISILAVVYALGFWAIGVEHALLFAIVTALLRIIPYFGSFAGFALPVVFTILTGDTFWQPVLLLGFFMLTQLLEANLLTPYITGSRVKLNPLATILVILLGSLLWGVAGMVLFVPLFASLKVIFDRVPQLKPYGYILGKEESPDPAPEAENQV